MAQLNRVFGKGGRQREGDKLEAPTFPVHQEFDRKLETFKKDGTLDYEIMAQRLKELASIAAKNPTDAREKVGIYAEQVLLTASSDTNPKAIRLLAFGVIAKLPKDFAPACKYQLAFVKQDKDRDIAAAADRAAKELGLGNLKPPPKDRPLGVPGEGPNPVPGPYGGPAVPRGRKFGGPNLQLPPRRN